MKSIIVEHYLDSSSSSSSRDLLRSDDPDDTMSRIDSKSNFWPLIFVIIMRAPSRDILSIFNPSAELSRANLSRGTSHFSTASLTSLMAAGCPKFTLQTSIRKRSTLASLKILFFQFF